MTLLIIYFLTALIISFICSIMEATLLSITPSYIFAKKNEKKPFAKSLKKFKEKIDLPLSAILTFNTFANTIGAVGVGVQAQIIWGSEYISIISAVLTISILIFSEIIPKTLGATYWKTLAPATSTGLKIMIYSPLYPIILLAKLVTFILKKNKDQNILSRSEFNAIAQIGIEEGIFKEAETQILTNLMLFSKIDVKNIMTPRTVVLAADENDSVKDFYENFDKLRFSRIPIYNDNIDNINGFILKDDLMQNIINKDFNKTLKSISREIKIINENMPIVRLFYKLIEEKEHIAMVVGEYGEMVGIVTMEDIIETLLGTEIVDELDYTTDMQEQARKNWEKRAKKLGIIE
ncbi:MAG: CNNM domain-containing protein [Bacteroidales bacterium]|jgi:CBS domain containing-hemolysin-like protein|nr:CNNM domain-containing protein [Bacteroidales bacterium]